MARQRNVSFTPDSRNMQNAGDKFYSDHRKDFLPSVSQLVNTMGKRNLAEQLAEATGTKVKSQYENIRRWERYEAGFRDSQSRNPEKAAGTRSTLDRLAREHNAIIPPNKRMNIRIQGTFKISNDVRNREGTSAIDVDLEPEDGKAFLDAILAGDMQSAYENVFAAYGTEGMEAGNDVRIDITY